MASDNAVQISEEDAEFAEIAGQIADAMSAFEINASDSEDIIEVTPDVPSILEDMDETDLGVAA